MNRWLKVGVISTAAAAAAAGVVSRYMVHSLTKPKRMGIDGNPAGLGMTYEDVSFPAAGDGVMLRGWYVKASDSGRCIIMTHGGGHHRADPTIGTLELAKGLADHGYDVLMYDLRGHGQSDYGRMTGGYYERRDVQGAIAYVKERGVSPRHIGLLGFSLGAAASLLAAAEDTELPAVVSDSCWADLMDLIERQIAKRPYMPGFLTPIVPSIARKAYGVDVAEVKPLGAAARIAPRPIFFIHGEFDETVPVENALRLYHSSENPDNRLWVVPEAGHVRSFKTQPEQYISKVAAFFDRELK